MISPFEFLYLFNTQISMLILITMVDWVNWTIMCTNYLRNVRGFVYCKLRLFPLLIALLDISGHAGWQYGKTVKFVYYSVIKVPYNAKENRPTTSEYCLPATAFHHLLSCVPCLFLVAFHCLKFPILTTGIVIIVSGYGQVTGGIMCLIYNNHPTQEITVTYMELIPWFIRMYLHTLKIEHFSSQSGKASDKGIPIKPCMLILI